MTVSQHISVIEFTARIGRWAIIGCWGILAICGLPRCGIAEESLIETRDFSVFVDDQPAGKCRHQYDFANGELRVTTHADISVRILLYLYKYQFDGVETWENSRLVKLTSHAVDDGKKLSVTADYASPRSRLIVGGKEKRPFATHWTTSYAVLPEMETNSAELQVLVSDTGDATKVVLKKLGNEEISTRQERIACSRYRVSGDHQADLWYDSSGRLVLQKSVEDGHRTELRLVNRKVSRGITETASSSR